jgi:type II secretory pathway pseudopilin PulG
MKNTFRKINDRLAGFSLLETIVVLFIVSVGLLGIVNLTISSLKAQTLNRNTLIAYQLSQEGLELIRNVRDNNWLADRAWDYGITGTATGTKYKVDFSNFWPVEVNDIDEATLQLASSTNPGFYLHDPASPNSLFSRMITITIATTTAASSTVESLVQWTDQGQQREYRLQTIIYDWQ